MEFTFNNQKYMLVLYTLAGSRFYGTHFNGKGTVDENGNSMEHPLKPDYISDQDFRGIFVAHPDTKLGLTGTIEQIEVKKDKYGVVPLNQQELIKELNSKLNLNMPLDEDIALYEIKKFINLALDANPNILDLLFADEDAIIYSDDKGKQILENRDIFLSKKTKFTFSGYAFQQIKKAKGHYKMINKYPKNNAVIHKLEDAFENKDIDFNWITDMFGGDVSKFITKMTQEEANKLGKIQSITWEEFVEKYSDDYKEFREICRQKDLSDDEFNDLNKKEIFSHEWKTYRKPQLINYVFPKDLKAHKLDMEEGVWSLDGSEALTKDDGEIITIKEFLLTEAAFRTISKTQLNIFTSADDKYKGGIFSRNGKLRSNDPEEVGDFVFQLTINENTFKADTDEVKKLWDWRTNRNDKRSILEEAFGYDVKHMSHTCRLLIGGGNILRTGEYQPRLDGDNLKLVRSVLGGKYTYAEVVEMAENYEQELNELYKKSTLPKTANHKKANKLLLDLSRGC